MKFIRERAFFPLMLFGICTTLSSEAFFLFQNITKTRRRRRQISKLNNPSVTPFRRAQRTVCQRFQGCNSFDSCCADGLICRPLKNGGGNLCFESVSSSRLGGVVNKLPSSTAAVAPVLASDGAGANSHSATPSAVASLESFNLTDETNCAARISCGVVDTSLSCQCDQHCLHIGDCCPDACEVCGVCENSHPATSNLAEPSSPAMTCIDRSCHYDPDAACQCDILCTDEGDCCLDACEACKVCSPVAPLTTYRPGYLTKREHGIEWSAGLSGKIIAKTDALVGSTGRVFHPAPDAAACIEHPNGDGWAYISNAEDPSSGGVGVLHFDANGDVADYQIVLQNTQWNCGGGMSPWGTWISCEENDADGRIFEVDPWGGTELGTIPFDSTFGFARETCLGKGGGNFESVAVDNRDPGAPVFYVTMDNRIAEIRRYRPHAAWVAQHINSEYWKILAIPAHGECQGTLDFLNLVDDNRFEWSATRFPHESPEGGEIYNHLEGIDFKSGRLYTVSKSQKLLYTLDVDLKTYTTSSTASGTFHNQPDQLKHIMNSDDGILYFCEDGGPDCGVHARDPNGRPFTILESCSTKQGCDNGYRGETTGLAFSPDTMHMYVSFQKPGHIFDVTRDDGKPFNSAVVDIKFHA